MTAHEKKEWRPRLLTGWTWDALAILGFFLLWTEALNAVPAAARWTVDHDVRWLGCAILLASFAGALGALVLTVSLALGALREHTDNIGDAGAHDATSDGSGRT